MIKISIVEDRDEIRLGLVEALSEANEINCISHYDNPEEALLKLPLDQPELVLMDIGLPKMTGLECMIRLSLKNPEMDFLMFTVFEEDQMIFDALKAGAIGYVLKGDGIRGVINAIEEYQKGGAPMSRSIARKVLSSFNQPSATGKDLNTLSKRQRIVLEQLSLGLLNKEIAERLGISIKTVKQHNNAIYKKLQVSNRTEAVRKYLGHTD